MSNSVTQLIAKSRFVLRTDYFDVKVVCHSSSGSEQETEAKNKEAPLKKGRLIIAVPRRVGSAPIRNRCRRRLRELMRTMGLSLLPVDFIFFVRSSFATIPVAELRAMLEKLRLKVNRLSYLK